MAKITDDQIKWTLSLDAGGVQGEINTLSSTIRSLEKENISLSKSMKDIDREMKQMEREMAKLTKAGKEDGAEFQKLSRRYQEAQVNLDDLSGEYKSNQKAIDDNRNAVKTMEKEMSLTDMTMKQLKQRASELSRQLEVTSASANPEEFERLQKELEATNNRMGEISSQGQSLTGVLSSIPGPIGSTITSLKGLGTAMKALMASGPGLIIMAIVAAFYALKTAIEGSDEATTKFNGVMSALGSIFDSYKRAVTEYVALLYNLITMDFSAMKENAKALLDIGSNLGKNIEAAYDASIAEDKLNDSIAINNDLIKVNEARISELRQTTQDSTKSLKERMDASKELMQLETKNYDMAVENIAGQYNVWKGANANMIDAIKRGSQKQYEEIEKYMKIVSDGGTLTNEEMLRMVELTNEVSANLDRSGEAAKNTFRGFANSLADTSKAYYDGTKREAKQQASILKEAAEKAYEDRLKAIEEGAKKETIAIKKANEGKVDSDKLIEVQLLELKSSELEKKLKLHKQYGKDVIDLEVELFENRQSIQKIAITRELEAIDRGLQEQLLLLNNMLLSRDITDKEFHDLSNNKAIESNNHKIAISKKYGIDTLDLEKSLSDKRISSQKAADKELLKSISEVKDNNLKIIKDEEDRTLRELERSHKNGLISDADYEARRLNISTKYANARLVVEINNSKALEQLKLGNIEGAEDAYKKAIESTSEAAKQAGIATEEEIENLGSSFGKIRDIIASVEFPDGFQGLQNAFANTFDEIDALAKKKGKATFTDYSSAALSIMGGLTSAIGDSFKKVFELETATLEAEKNKQLEIAGDNAEAREAVEMEFAQKQLDLKKKQADVDCAIQSSQLWIQTAMGIVSTWVTSMALGPIAGPIVAGVLTAALLATAGIQQATIIKQRDAIKSQTLSGGSPSAAGTPTPPPTGSVVLKEGYADGGYTGPGGKYEIAGTVSNGAPVHKGEYVIAQQEMTNPMIVPMVRAIEAERRKRTYRNPLPASYGSGYADGGYAPHIDKSGSDSMIKAVGMFSEAVDRLVNTTLKSEINYQEFKQVEKMMGDLQRKISKK